jgi:hypothetical protein
MVLRGRVQDGVIVLEGSVQLPEGVFVRVETVDGDDGAKTSDVYQLDQFAGRTGIPDLALNIDHYLYGHPKQGDGKP